MMVAVGCSITKFGERSRGPCRARRVRDSLTPPPSGSQAVLVESTKYLSDGRFGSQLTYRTRP